MLIGREKEVRELRQAYDSEESKFVFIFGRWRIVIVLTMITSSSLVKNSYSMNSIHSQITADDLFVDA
ncbi:MAG: hypothetical protein K2K75_03905 [Muribaculaceae bacterium]|nr:hypothetical protein [Muribaculaceae bacterium]